MSNEKTTDWPALFTELREAKSALEAAELQVSIARSKECDCLNRVNRAQGAINKAIQEEKKAAPRSTDWAREQRPHPKPCHGE